MARRRGLRDVIHTVGSTVRLSLRHRGAAVAYARNATDVQRVLGREAADLYGDLVDKAADAGGDLAVQLARTLPDALGRVAPRNRRKYARLVLEVIRTRPSAAVMVARETPELYRQMDVEAARAFVLRALVLHQDSPQRAESFLRRESAAGQAEAKALVTGVGLEDVRRVLVMYARGHCGADVDVKALPTGQRAYASGRAIHLPERVDDYGDDRDFLAYRVMTAQCAGYLEFGSFDLAEPTKDGEPGDDPFAAVLASYGNRSLARDLLQVLEDRRVEVRVRGAYPGVARDLDRLRASPARPRPEISLMAPTEQVVEALARHAWGMPVPDDALPDVLRAVRPLLGRLDEVTSAGSSVRDVVAALPEFYAAASAFLRSSEDKKRPPTEQEAREEMPRDGALRDDGGDGDGGGEGTDAGEGDDTYRSLDLPTALGRLVPDDVDEPRPGELDDEPVEGEATPDGAVPGAGASPARASYEEMEAWLDREQGPRGGVVERGEEQEAEAVAATGAPILEPATATYDEWDFAIDDYKPRWVRVVEQRVEPGDGQFVDEVRRAYGPLIRRLRRQFEALRPEANARISGLVDGEELDVDAVVRARVERRAGGQPSDRLYVRRLPVVRDVCATFLVDLSSSTNEVVNTDGKRIIDVEKEALVCIAEAVSALGDRFAIHGFSGYGREHVAFYVAKDFDEPFDERARNRVGALRWKMENRDGAAIRHATKRLLAEPARQRLLFLLSDGRPLDCGCDHYFDRYAWEDTRVALQEARRAQVHPFCLTVDPRGADYLETMYGRGGYTVVERVEALPTRLFSLYRRLTR